MDDCLFCRIIEGKIPSDKVYEDDLCVVIKDIAPKAPVHLLVLPKKHFASLARANSYDQSLLGHLLLVAAESAKKAGLTDFRTVINTGADAGQTVFHLHVHVIGGKRLSDEMA